MKNSLEILFAGKLPFLGLAAASFAIGYICLVIFLEFGPKKKWLRWCLGFVALPTVSGLFLFALLQVRFWAGAVSVEDFFFSKANSTFIVADIRIDNEMAVTLERNDGRKMNINGGYGSKLAKFLAGKNNGFSFAQTELAVMK